jgi:hypothetical protein
MGVEGAAAFLAYHASGSSNASVTMAEFEAG